MQGRQGFEVRHPAGLHLGPRRMDESAQTGQGRQSRRGRRAIDGEVVEAMPAVAWRGAEMKQVPAHGAGVEPDDVTGHGAARLDKDHHVPAQPGALVVHRNDVVAVAIELIDAEVRQEGCLDHCRCPSAA